MPKPRATTTFMVILVLAGFELYLGISPGRATDAGAVRSIATPGAPITVSPGSAAGSRIGSVCPTFSWGAVAGAERYELIVYLLSEGNEEAEPVLLEAVSGSASSWTPSLDRCFEPGSRYAWSVRAFDSEKTSDWSAPRLFQVTASLSEMELERALEVVRQYVESRGGVEAADAEEVTTEEDLSASPEATDALAAETLLAPQPLAPAGTELSVDGNVDAVSFSGSGSQLTELNPAPPCYSATDRFVDCGNGTVADGVTGLIWMKNANCYGLMDWETSNTIATTFNLAVCGVTDGSRPGDWRLPTKEEWEAIVDPVCSSAPKIMGNSGCYSVEAWALNVQEGFYWSSSTLAGTSTKAHDANLVTGDVPVLGRNKNNSVYFWPVRRGQ